MTAGQVMRPNRSFIEFPITDIDQTIAQRFEQQARRHPGRLAVKIGSRSLTYKELNGAANRVARAIARRYKLKTERIAVYCGAGMAMIVASLAALKAGKAFVPLNTQLPASKVKEILASLDDCPVLTDNDHGAAALEIAADADRLLNVDEIDRRLSPKNLDLAVSPHAIAYINFTSGSTGEPKGVMWNHRSELFGIKTKTEALKISPTDRISLLRSNNVGAARDMFLALLNGAALIVLDPGGGGLASLGDWLRAESITVFTCVATVFRRAVNGTDGTKGFPAVRLIHIGGEPIFKSDVEIYRKYFSDHCRFVSRYSISETQAVCYYFINKQTRIDGDRVPVGYSLAGNEVLILDDAGNEAAPGAVGEIAVRSPYLALGYWRQPDLTRAKFIADSRVDTRTYLTGDLGYQLPDGCLIHLGRKDFQAKVKGHRVEITAVETALNEIPAIHQAAVVAEPDPAKGSRLIAYVVPGKNARPNVDEWRAALKSKLPAFMIPEVFVVRENLPLNTGGKVDRSALPLPTKNNRAGDAALKAPRNAVEKVLAGFWRDALHLNTVSVHDDLTTLGGDSISAAQLVAKITGLFPLSEPLTSLFQTPSIAESAKFIIDHEPQAGQAEKIASIFLAVEEMSDGDVLKSIDESGGAGSDG